MQETEMALDRLHLKKLIAEREICTKSLESCHYAQNIAQGTHPGTQMASEASVGATDSRNPVLGVPSIRTCHLTLHMGTQVAGEWYSKAKSFVFVLLCLPMTIKSQVRQQDGDHWIHLLNLK